MCEYKERYQMAAVRYLSEIRATGLSSRTVSNYTKRLRYFGAFWMRQELKSDPRREDIRAWRDDLLAAGTAPSTVKQYMIELGTFFEYCLDDEIYVENPVNKRLYPKAKADKKYEKILSSEELALLWENSGAGRNWARNYAITVLLLDGKIRNAELLDIKPQDVDFRYKELFVPKGKGNKARTVSLSDISISAIQLYLKSGIRPAGCGKDAPLFGTETKGKWHRGTSSWLSSLVEKHVRQVTGVAGIRTHALRHNGSVFDLNNGSSLERLQAELGHASVTTTEIYAGRLGSKRQQDGFKIAVCARDYWASKNMILLRSEK